MSCTHYAPYDCIWYFFLFKLFRFLQGKCTAHSFVLCPSHSSPLLLSLSCRRLTALSCKSIANQSNKEPQQICLRRRRMRGRGRGRIDWWGWGAWDWDWPNGRLLIWPSCDWIVVTPTCLPNIQTRSLSLLLVLSASAFLSPFFSLPSISLTSPWWHFPLTEVYVDYRLRLQHFPLILTIMPLSIIYSAAALWPPIPTSTLSLPYPFLSLSLSHSLNLCISFTRCQSVNLVEWVFDSIWIHTNSCVYIYAQLGVCVCVCRHRTYS